MNKKNDLSGVTGCRYGRSKHDMELQKKFDTKNTVEGFEAPGVTGCRYGRSSFDKQMMDKFKPCDSKEGFQHMQRTTYDEKLNKKFNPLSTTIEGFRTLAFDDPNNIYSYFKSYTPVASK